MPDTTINSKLKYILYIQKLITITFLSGFVILLLFYFSESDLFVFLGLLLGSWAILYGLVSILNLLFLMRKYKALAKKMMATILFILLGFAIASIQFYIGFKMFVQFSD